MIEKMIVEMLRTLSKGAKSIKLKVYLPTIVVEELRKVFKKRASQVSWSTISVSEVLSFLADMIE